MSEMNWKLIVLVIVVSCILSSVSTIALFNLTPGLFTIKSEQIPDGLITSNKVSDEAIVTIKLSN